MNREDLLNGGIDTLSEINQYLLELQENEEKERVLQTKEQEVEKQLETKQKEIEEEINKTLKLRKQEISGSFEEQLDKIRVRAKKLKQKRNKEKEQKVSERIDAETSGLRSEQSRIKLEINAVLKRERLPKFCNSRLFLALYSPAGIKDIFIILLTLFLTLFVIPYGSFKLFVPASKPAMISVIYIACFIVFGGIYIFLNNSIKEPHKGALKQVRGLKKEFCQAKKKTYAMEKKISKDPDESSYGLEEYDAEMDGMRKEEQDVTNQMKDALLVFENETSKSIQDDIRLQYKETIDGLQQELQNVSKQSEDVNKRIKDIKIKLSTNYESNLGKDMIRPEVIEALTQMIASGEAYTIKEAIQLYREGGSQPEIQKQEK